MHPVVAKVIVAAVSAIASHYASKYTQIALEKMFNVKFA